MLAPGTRLSGRYEIVGWIGAGGMGEVYAARDKSLDRDVAVKILPEEFVSDAERVARFEREAKLLASLGHPNIAVVHGFEEAQGRRFLVLELVEGETLAERISRGRLPVDEALEVCRQIAEGLEAAHERGIVHRDLKPANVKITPEGKVKLLDFGLAKAGRARDAAADPAHSPTITGEMTRPGVVLGTAAYMSPEQAKGKAVDKRADIWAFGCVLYECLTGKRAFQGETITETLAAILKGEPDWTALPADTPLAARAVIARCLRKDVHSRLRDIADARAEMFEDVAGTAAEGSGGKRLPAGWMMAIGAGALVIGLMAGPALRRFLQPASAPKPPSVTRSIIRLESGHALAGLPMFAPAGSGPPTRTAISLSPDGRFLVYAADKMGPGSEDTRLFLRKLDELKSEPMPGTEGGINPFFSPDGRWIGFYAEGKLRKIAVEGGVPTALCDVASPFGFTWSDDGWIVFSPSRGAGLFRIPAEGGRAEPLTTPDRSRGEFSHRLPHALPGGKGVLFTIKRHAWDAEPLVAGLKPGSRTWKVLLEDAADARFLPSGHLVFLRKGTLMVAGFDPDALEIIGQPVAAVAGVEQALATTYSTRDTAAGQFCVSPSGALVYAAGGVFPDQENTLVWFDRGGKAENVTSIKAPFWAPRLSPDGRRIVYAALGMTGFLRVMDLDRGTDSKLTTEGVADFGVWTPDGRRVAFDWVGKGVPNIYWQPIDGSEPMERLTRSENIQWPSSWSPDGRALAFLEADATIDAGYDIHVLQLADRRVTPFLKTRFNEFNPFFSPDGRWLAYTSDESGREEIYVRPFPGPGGKWQVSDQGGVNPLWSRDGKELFYMAPGQEGPVGVYAVDVRTDPDFWAGKPRLLFSTAADIQWDSASTIWDITPDGKKFLMVELGERKARPVTELVLVQNWSEEIRRLAAPEREVP